MIQKVKNVLKKRKVKLFFLFLLCSGLAWFISNLSDRYSSNTSFALEYVNFPDSLMLLQASKERIDVRLEAVGFQLLAYNLGKKEVKIDLSQVKVGTSGFFIGPNECRRQIERQLPNGVALSGTDGDSLFFGFYGVITKKIPVRSGIQLSLAQNYLLDGPLVITPDSLTIKGPKSEIDTINSLKTDKIELNGLTNDFSVRAAIFQSPDLENTLFSEASVQVKGKVARFSEKVIRVPVQVLNLPEGTSAQTFPDAVQILIKAKLADLKKIRTSDFLVTADYASVAGSNSKTLVLKLDKRPQNVYSSDLLESEVDFILKRE